MADVAIGLYSRDQEVIALSEQLRFFPLEAEAGVGATLIESGGRRLIDLSAGWGAASLGYAHPAVVAAVTDAVQSMPGVSVLSGTHRYVVELAERLLEATPTTGAERAVYVGHAGSDANSAVLRAVRAWSPRSKIAAFENSYHGGNGESLEVSGIGATGDDPGVVLVPYPDADAVERVLAGGDVAALFVEPILCDGGVVIPPAGFLTRLRELCTQSGTLLVVDEVKVGVARTGKLYAFQHDGITPDIVTVGKGLGGGLPLSAAIGPAEILSRETASSLLTVAGNPVSAAAGLAVLDVIDGDGLADRARRLGEHLGGLLAELQQQHPLVHSVRNRGLVGGIELRTAAGEPATGEAAKVVYRAWQLGVVVYYVGVHGNILELTPSLVIDEESLNQALAIVGQAIEDVESGVVPDHAIEEFAGW